MNLASQIFTNPVWLFIAILVILFLICYNIAIRTNKVSGTLVFFDGSAEIAEFGLYNGTNFRIITKKDLRFCPQLMLKKIKIVNLKSRSKKKNIDINRFEEDAAIQVFAETSQGRKFQLILYPKLETIYSDETFATMMYEPNE